MKIIVVGATGTIGKLVVSALKKRHEVIPAAKEGDALPVDMTDVESVQNLFRQTGQFDALVVAAGKVHFADFGSMTETELWLGLRDKLMGQVNLVRNGLIHASDGGSFTLTSGALSQDPIPQGVSGSMVNGAIDAFVRAAAIELPRGLRINSVSSGVLEESMSAVGQYFRGHEPVAGERVARAYVKSIEGRLTGQVFSVI